MIPRKTHNVNFSMDLPVGFFPRISQSLRFLGFFGIFFWDCGASVLSGQLGFLGAQEKPWECWESRTAWKNGISRRTRAASKGFKPWKKNEISFLKIRIPINEFSPLLQPPFIPAVPAGNGI